MITLILEAHWKVIEDAACGLSQRKLGEKYECGKTQIQNFEKEKQSKTNKVVKIKVIKTNKSKNKEKWFKNTNKNTKRETFCLYKEINDLTLAWSEGAEHENC